MDLMVFLVEHRGAAVKIAKAEGVAPSSVWEWAEKQVPAKRVLPIWRITGGAVRPHDMRPDLYPADVVEIVGEATEEMEA